MRLTLLFWRTSSYAGLKFTVVLDDRRLLAGDVSRDAVDLHPHQGVHDGRLLGLHFGQLLPRDHLGNTREYAEHFITITIIIIILVSPLSGHLVCLF